MKNYCWPAHAFARRYTAADVAMLGEADRAMGTLSGPATACVLRRQRDVFKLPGFERLADISVAHLYNLHSSAGYRQQRVVQTKTHLQPAIEQMLEQFPFVILGFHADNGSEYVNHMVAKLLEKLRIEFTRSRPRHSNDNGLAETKNGAVVRKEFGYAHIPQRHATRFNTYCREYLNPFLNFHRPCLFSSDIADAKKPGRIKRVYRSEDAMTPLDKLASLPEASRSMREGITLEHLRALAVALTDLQAGEELNEARLALFRRVPARTG
jgi:hypothetical protein